MKTYRIDREFKDVRVIKFYLIFVLPHCSSVLANCGLFRKLDVVQLPFSSNFCLVAEIDFDCAKFIDIYHTKVHLIYCVVISGVLLCKQYNLWPKK